MEVILLEKVVNLGNLGDKVNVRPGYGRNFLLPTGKAVAATPENVAKFEARRAELEAALAERRAEAQARAERLAGMSVTIPVKAGDEGRLFGSIGTGDVADAITAAGVEVTKKEVDLGGETFREVGEYEVRIRLHGDVEQTVTVVLAAE